MLHLLHQQGDLVLVAADFVIDSSGVLQRGHLIQFSPLQVAAQLLL